MKNIKLTEQEIELLIEKVLNVEVVDIGDNGSYCPFCHVSCMWYDEMKEVNHMEGCAYLIAQKTIEL